MPQDENLPSMPPNIPLTRENIRSGRIREWLAQNDKTFRPLSDSTRNASRMGMFEGGRPTEDVWLFGYGSLIWNPTIEHTEKRLATVHGLHRRFCLWSHQGRGTPERPGLMLALDRGGCCRGVVYRIPIDRAEDELDIIWRREMVSNSYRPRWLNAATSEGTVPAIGFVINRRHERYAGALLDTAIAHTIAHAHGFLGPCCEYLFNTVEHLDALGMPDAGLSRLARQVRAAQRA